MFKKIVSVAAVSAVAFGVSWGAGAANAATFADTSVQILPHQSVDAITSVSAAFDGGALGAGATVGTPGTPLGSAHSIAFTAGGTHGPLTWTATEANFSGDTPWVFTMNPATGVLGITAPVHVALDPNHLPVIAVSVTDGSAVAKDVLTVTAGHVIGSGNDKGKVDTVTISVTSDTVTLSGANNNAAGTVDFTSVPGGASFSVANNPAGTHLAGNALTGTFAVPGPYDGLRVTASDAGGAVAVDTFNAFVKGAPVITRPSHPVPTVPFVYHGHVLTGDAHNATVGWLDGIPGNAAAWGSGLVNGQVNHCVEVFIFGFDRPAGTAHVGFTCDNGNPAANVGMLRGLAPGHTYALFVQPATGTYAHNVPIPGTDAHAHITVVTPAA